MNSFNDRVIAEFRAQRGIVGGPFATVRLLLLHLVERRTGTPQVVPLLYLRDGDSLVVVGSNGGAKREPAWVANIEAMPEVAAEVGTQTLTFRPTFIRQRTPEREQLWDQLVEYWPDFLAYEKDADRLFPLVRLIPVGSEGHLDGIQQT